MTPAGGGAAAGLRAGRLNIVISGGTGSGKTTTLNVLSSFIPDDERIVTIEDAAELRLRQEHVIRLESRPANLEERGEITIRDLVRNALRMRPDRIIIGEVRDGAALDMLQAMNTGHDGSITTVHSNSPRDTLSRLETMVLMAASSCRSGHPRADGLGDRLDHPPVPAEGRHPAHHPRHGGEGMESGVVMLQDLFLSTSRLGRTSVAGTVARCAALDCVQCS